MEELQRERLVGAEDQAVIERVLALEQRRDLTKLRPALVLADDFRVLGLEQHVPAAELLAAHPAVLRQQLRALDRGGALRVRADAPAVQRSGDLVARADVAVEQKAALG